MPCHKSHLWMSLKIDGRLPEPQERLLQAHLVSCPDCAREWARWQEVDRLFAGAPMVAPDGDFAARVLQRLDRQSSAVSASRRYPAFVAFGLGLAAALALLALAVSAGIALLDLLASPATLIAAVRAASHAARIAVTCLEALRLLLWGTANSPSILVAIGYVALALGALATWLRVAVFHTAPQPLHLGPEQ